MALIAQDLARVAAAEASQLRMHRLQRMSHYQLRALLTGDPLEAAAWVTSAAEHGLPAAQLRLGRMLLDGCGIDRDPARALYWFRRAAEQLDAEAMNMVGRCYENGWGIAVDITLAAHWYRQSALRGHNWGQYNFGNMLFDGLGVGQDTERAVLWYASAARQRNSRAMNLIGRCCEEGWGCRRNLVAAFDWYRRSAQAGYFRGQFNFAVLLCEHGFESQAADWFFAAASSGTSELRRAISSLLRQARHPALAAVRIRLEGIAG